MRLSHSSWARRIALLVMVATITTHHTTVAADAPARAVRLADGISERVAAGRAVKVVLTDGTRLQGVVLGVKSERFSMAARSRGGSHTVSVPFAQVQAVSNWRPGKVAWIFIGVAIAVLVVLAVLQARDGNA